MGDDHSDSTTVVSSMDSSASGSTASWADTEIVEPHVGYKKVLVTGGAGFIGSHVAEYLLARGDDVVIIDEINDYYDVNIKESNLKLLKYSYPEEGRVSIYRGDICDRKLMESIFETENIKWVCHMAARAGVRPSIKDPFVYIHSNINATTHLMELSHKHGIENFVFASSSSVYGGSKSTFFSEDEVVDHPVSPYAASKKPCELLAYTYHHLYQLKVTGLRFFTVYAHVAALIWHLSSSPIASTVEKRCNNLVMVHRAATTRIFLILSMVSSAPSIGHMITRSSILGKARVHR